MPNIGIHGFEDNKKVARICKLIDLCMQTIGLKDEAVKEVFFSAVLSCDGLNTFKPYLRIFSRELEHIPRILAGFQEHMIYEDVEAFPDLFFTADEITSGAWRKKLYEKFPLLEKEVETTRLRCLDGISLCEPDKKPKGFCNTYMCGG